MLVQINEKENNGRNSFKLFRRRLKRSILHAFYDIQFRIVWLFFKTMSSNARLRLFAPEIQNFDSIKLFLLLESYRKTYRRDPSLNIDFSISNQVKTYDVGLKNSSTRDKWVEKALRGLPVGYRLLDAGAGECQYQKYCEHLTYVSQDFSQYDGTGQDGLQTGTWDTSRIDIVSDITNIPVEDASFDAVLCTEVLEHVPDPVAAIKEMARIIRAGGVMIITAPFCSLTHFAPFHFASGLNQYFYEHHFSVLGFEIVETQKNGNYFEYMAQELRRIEDVTKRYTDGKVDILNQFYISENIKLMQYLSALDQGSNDLLFFGFHLIARKRIN